MRLEDYLNEIESWIEQVEDEEVDPEEYDFIDRVVHKGRDGNDGLGQVGAYLAVYEQDGEVQTDDELIEVLEERQAELPQGGRNRFSNILSEGKTKKRQDGNTIQERDVDGHQRLYNMIEAAREHLDPDAEVEETRYPDGENPRTNKTGVTFQLIQGENTTMTDDLDRHADYVDDVLTRVENNMMGKETAVRNLHNYMTNEIGYGQVEDFAERYEDLVDDVVDLLDGVEDRVDEHESDMNDIGNDIDTELSNFGSYIDFMSNVLDNTESRMDTADSRLDR